MSQSESNRPIFYDPAGRRHQRLIRLWLVLGGIISSLIVILIVSVLINPLLPALDLRPLPGLPLATDTRLRPPPLVTTLSKQNQRRAELALERALATSRPVPARKPSQIKIPSPLHPVLLPRSGSSNKPVSVGFYVNWDDSSYQSLKRNLTHLDWIMPEWIRLQAGNEPLVLDIDPRAYDLIRRQRPEMPVIPLVQNSKQGLWDSEILVQTLVNRDARRHAVSTLMRFVDEHGFSGVCIDFEQVPAKAHPFLFEFMYELAAAFRAKGRIVAQAVPLEDQDWDYRAYGNVADYLLLMGYDEHWGANRPGSVAGQTWFERALVKQVKVLDPTRTIICLGAFGYDWPSYGDPKDVTFQEAILTAQESEATISFDALTRNPYYVYYDDNGARHSVWFLDAVTAYNQMVAASQYPLAGVALWRLGSEDPSLWSIFGSARGDFNSLRQIKYGYDVDFEGAGEILQVVAEPKEGRREIAANPASGLIEHESYVVMPSPYVIRRTGKRQGLIALTFDDGPDPLWTPAILNILKQANILSTFFIIGRNAQAHPELVRRIVAEGHEIGNHTFTHPNLGEIRGRITELELNATQRLIESLVGRSTRLFRPPYFGDAEPSTPDEVKPVVRAQKLGYTTVGLRIDPEDWALPGAAEIVRRTIQGATSPDEEQRGNVVLLHDSGGNRSQTVEALPQIIYELGRRGFSFVTISQLAGFTRDQVMPPLPPEQGFFTRANAITFYTLSFTGWTLYWGFLLGIIFALGRFAFIGSLAYAQWRRSRRRMKTSAGDTYEPFVSIVVPAFNEERVIVRTIESLLNSTYPLFEVVVVDDGSVDRTSTIVRERFHADPRVRLFTAENRGKAEALTFGLKNANGEIIVALDADTVFAPETIGALAHRFYDPRIGAIAGNAKVGNRVNLLTRWQALEYITAQNLERRAFASLNCITVVPGAVGAWRQELLTKAGGFSADTLAEDQDLTLRIRRLGFKIGYEENAIAWTEAPDTWRGFAKQRFRWSFGTLQCMWKHRDALFRPHYGTLGLIAMPNVWLFQILFPLISPVIDLMLLWTLATAILDRLAHQSQYVITNLYQVLFYYALFIAVDWLAAAFAFLLEKRDRASLLWLVFLQRFFYRQIMYYVMIKSVITALRGPLVGWGKLERKATVEAKP